VFPGLALKYQLKDVSWYFPKACTNHIECRSLMQQVCLHSLAQRDLWIHVQADGRFDHMDTSVIPLLGREESACTSGTLNGKTRTALCNRLFVGLCQGQIVQQTRYRQRFMVWLQVVDL